MHTARGNTLIGIVIATGIFAILAYTIFNLIASTYQLVSFSRSRITARHLAQEKIELIRNLPYDDVGTQGGIPTGTLAQNEQVIVNGLNYQIKTNIVYIDDPFDDVAPADLLPTDYKRTRVDVSWEGLAASKINPVTLITDIAPKGTETAAGTGTLSILVHDSQGQPVPQAQVNIFTDQVTPNVNLNLQTNDDGRVILPGTPGCTSDCYQIIVTKDGFSSEHTYSTGEVANPDPAHQNVLEAGLTEIFFSIDKLSTLEINTLATAENNFAPVGGVNFTLRLLKEIGTNELDEPIYKFEENYTTSSGGTLNLENIEWGNYQFILDTGESYTFAGSNPLNPMFLAADNDSSFDISLSTPTNNSLLATFTSSDIPVATVSATLSKDPDYNETKITGDGSAPNWGQVFFSDLEIGNYTLTATASGYLDNNSIVNINGNTTINIPLGAQE